MESVGTSSDYVDNFGRFNNRIIQGDGADVTINRPGGTINGQVSQGGAQDWFQMLGGLLNQDVQQGDGPDDAWINGGLINGGVGTGTGEDHLLWDGGNIKGFGIDMGDDDDVAVFRELTPDNLTSGLKIDGGLGDDELFWQTTTGADVSRVPAVGDLRSHQRLGTDLRRHPDDGRLRHRHRRALHRPDEHRSCGEQGRGRARSGAERQSGRRHLE